MSWRTARKKLEAAIRAGKVAAVVIWRLDRLGRTANLQFLREGDRRYIIGTPKSMLKQFERELLDASWDHVREGVELKPCKSPDGKDKMFILCRSRDRVKKEKAIFTRFESRMKESTVPERISPRAAGGNRKSSDTTAKRRNSCESCYPEDTLSIRAG